MSRRITYNALASIELEEAALFYEERGSALGRSFLDAVVIAVERLAEYPELGKAAANGLRRLGVFRFPYSVFYRSLDGEIRVVGIRHDRRRPRSFRERR